MLKIFKVTESAMVKLEKSYNEAAARSGHKMSFRLNVCNKKQRVHQCPMYTIGVDSRRLTASLTNMTSTEINI